MTENKKKKFFGHPARVAVLAAALAACLGLTAFAASPVGQEMLQEIFVTFTYTDNGDGSYVLSVDGVKGDMDDFSVVNAVVFPTMAYEERDGRQILTLDGEELDVTEAMEKDGFYEQKLEGATLRVTADGIATITTCNEDGEVGMSYTMYLNEDGVDHSFGEVSNYSVEIGGDAEVTGIYTVTSESSFTATDSDGNVVVVETGNLPE